MAQGMKTLIAIIMLFGAFSLGWVISRHQVLKEYPPEAVRLFAETAGQQELLKNIHHYLSLVNQQFDYQALYEGCSARYFQLALDREGEAAAKALAEKAFHVFLLIWQHLLGGDDIESMEADEAGDHRQALFPAIAPFPVGLRIDADVEGGNDRIARRSERREDEGGEKKKVFPESHGRRRLRGEEAGSLMRGEIGANLLDRK